MTGTPVVLPVTNGGNFARIAGFAVPLDDAGMRTVGVVRCDRPRALDMASRHGRKLEDALAEIVEDVMARLATIFE
ncbi:mRNA-degrading endonuclease toxin of MazEF toxin-antitoxin module [Erwinia aphidicola]|nr:mRNA-degrading endonuclease toxin of MazEF toxin-antitoxin module [Erwinia aphidicola]